MKNYILMLGLLAGLHANAQTTNSPPERVKKNNEQKEICQKIYFDLTSGINGNAGQLGIGVDAHVADLISLNGGAGFSLTWGYKGYLGGKYFLNPCHKGWAFGGGVTYSSGLQYEDSLETVYSTREKVMLDLLPQVNVYVSAYKYWELGKRNNRVSLQLGWSLPMVAQKFEQVGGSPITKPAGNIIRFLSPGGLIVGVGFNFTGK